MSDLTQGIELPKQPSPWLDFTECRILPALVSHMPSDGHSFALEHAASGCRVEALELLT